MKKVRLVSVFLSVLLILSSCGGGEVTGEGEGANASSTTGVYSENSKDDGEKQSKVEFSYPKIDGIEWFFENGVSYGEPAALFGYKNNTGFTIVELDVYFHLKDELTTAEMSIFSDVRDSFDLSDEELKELTPSVRDYMVCEQGETVKGAVCYLKASLEATSTTQTEMLVLESATISYVGADGKKHTVFYSAVNNGYSTKETAEELYVWSESDYAKLVPQPDTSFAEVDYDEPDYFQFTAYDIDSEGYSAYINTCKDAGFNNDTEESSLSFWGTDNAGNVMNVRFFPAMNAIEVVVKPE